MGAVPLASIPTERPSPNLSTPYPPMNFVEPPGQYHAAFAVPLSFDPAGSWSVTADLANKLVLTDGDPTEPAMAVMVERPIGYPTAAAFLAAYSGAVEPSSAGELSGLPISDGCVGWTERKSIELAGLNGTGFECDGSAVGQIGPLYPESESAFQAGWPGAPSDPEAFGWFWPQGELVRVFVADVDSAPLIITTQLFGATQSADGPTVGAIAQATALLQTMQFQP